MALVTCHECGHNVSTEAKNCPSCGAKPQAPKVEKKSSTKLLLGCLVGVVVLSTFFGSGNSAEKQAAQSAEVARVAALTPEQRAKEQAATAAKASEAEAKAVAARAANEEATSIRKAHLECQLNAEASAHDPGSIEWLRDERQFTFTTSDKLNGLSILPMRAKNSFGALIRTGVRCEMKLVDGTWRVKRLSQFK